MHIDFPSLIEILSKFKENDIIEHYKYVQPCWINKENNNFYKIQEKSFSTNKLSLSTTSFLKNCDYTSNLIGSIDKPTNRAYNVDTKEVWDIVEIYTVHMYTPNFNCFLPSLAEVICQLPSYMYNEKNTIYIQTCPLGIPPTYSHIYKDEINDTDYCLAITTVFVPIELNLQKFVKDSILSNDAYNDIFK